MLAHKLKDAVAKYFTKKRMAITYELGLCRRGRLRADVFAISMKGTIVVVECKSSVQDYLRDFKWKSYLKYANQFYFAVDHPTYEKLKSEIPKGIGILVVDEVPTRSGTKLKTTVVQRAKSQEVDAEIERELWIRMIFRNSDFTRYSRRNS